jgi:hypothetical protein
MSDAERGIAGRAVMKTKTMDELCLDHARVAARHVKMKNLDRTKAGAALMAEGLGLIFGIDAELAGFLAKDVGETVSRQLIERRLKQARQDGATEKETMAFRRAAAAALRKEPFRCVR